MLIYSPSINFPFFSIKQKVTKSGLKRILMSRKPKSQKSFNINKVQTTLIPTVRLLHPFISFVYIGGNVPKTQMKRTLEQTIKEHCGDLFDAVFPHLSISFNSIIPKISFHVFRKIINYREKKKSYSLF